MVDSSIGDRWVFWLPRLEFVCIGLSKPRRELLGSTVMDEWIVLDLGRRMRAVGPVVFLTDYCTVWSEAG